MTQPPTYLVWSNPFCEFDHLGRLCGVVHTDAVEHTPYREVDQHAKDARWEPRVPVGARLDYEKTKVTRRGSDHMADGAIEQNTEWIFSAEPVLLPQTHYYRRAMLHEGLFPADQATAEAVGLEFRPRAECVAAAREKLEARWKTTYLEVPHADWDTEGGTIAPVSAEAPPAAEESPKLSLVRSGKKAVA